MSPATLATERSLVAANQRVLTFLVDLGLDVEADLAKLDDTEARLVVWPLEVLPEQELRAVQRLPFSYRARYLVLAGGTPADSAALLDRLIAAAVESTDPRLSIEPLDPQLWLALGVKPRPAVVLETPVQVRRAVERAPVVRLPLRVEEITTSPLNGRVLSEEGHPLPGVRVELTGSGATAYTDVRGAFRLGSVPTDGPIRLTLRKGEVMLAISSEQTPGELAAAGEPLDIRANFASHGAEEA